MTEPSTTEAKQVERAAKAHAKKSTAPDKETPDWIEQDFKAGVDWATTDPLILRGLLQPFAEWINERYCNDGDLKLWRELGTLNYYSDEELIVKYIQYITDKQKEDARQ